MRNKNLYQSETDLMHESQPLLRVLDLSLFPLCGFLSFDIPSYAILPISKALLNIDFALFTIMILASYDREAEIISVISVTI